MQILSGASFSYGWFVRWYADDTQIYGHSSPSSVRHLWQRLSSCVNDVASWLGSNRLQLNTAKIEVLWCTTSRRQHQRPVRFGADHVLPSKSVCILGTDAHADITMSTHVSRTVSRCFGTLRQLRTMGLKTFCSSSTQHFQIACHVPGLGSSRLRQRSLSWSSSIPTGPITISHKRWSSTDLRRHHTGSRDSHVAPALLAASRGKNSFQAGFSTCS